MNLNDNSPLGRVGHAAKSQPQPFPTMQQAGSEHVSPTPGVTATENNPADTHAPDLVLAPGFTVRMLLEELADLRRMIEILQPPVPTPGVPVGSFKNQSPSKSSGK